jgi:hypothetical protein
VPSAYPAALDTTTNLPTSVQDDTDSKAGTDLGVSTTTGHHAANHNEANSAILAVETELGVSPSASFVDVATRLNLITTVNKTANQTTTSTTGVAVTDMAFPVALGGDYLAEFWLIWSTNTAGVVAHFAATYPTFTNAVTFSENMGVVAPTTGGTDAVWDQVQTASGTYHTGFVGGTSLPAAAALSITRFTVSLANLTAAGTLQMNVKAEAAATITIYKASKGLLITN